MENQEKNSQMIVDDVISQIGSGRLKISEALPSEREMAQLYHVSRSCVREAMQVLALLGIVRIRPKEKTRVTAFQIEPFIRRCCLPSRAVNRTSRSSVWLWKSKRRSWLRKKVRMRA